MQRQEVKEIFDQIVRGSSNACTKDSQIAPESNFIDDLGFDSLATIKLISNIEVKFDIEFDVDELVYEIIGCYGTLLDNVMSKVEKKGKINE